MAPCSEKAAVSASGVALRRAAQELARTSGHFKVREIYQEALGLMEQGNEGGDRDDE